MYPQSIFLYPHDYCKNTCRRTPKFPVLETISFFNESVVCWGVAALAQLADPYPDLKGLWLSVRCLVVLLVDVDGSGRGYSHTYTDSTKLLSIAKGSRRGK